MRAAEAVGLTADEAAAVAVVAAFSVDYGAAVVAHLGRRTATKASPALASSVVTLPAAEAAEAQVAVGKNALGSGEKGNDDPLFFLVKDGCCCGP